jgi:hypothetical protein
LILQPDFEDLPFSHAERGYTKFVRRISASADESSSRAGREARQRARKRVVDDLPVKLARLSVLVAELLPTWSGYRGQGRTVQWRDRVLLVATWIVTRQHSNFMPFPLARDPLAAMIGLPSKTIERVVDCLVEVGFISRTTPVAVRRGPILLGLTPGASRVWYLPHQYLFSARVRSILDGQDAAPVEDEVGTEIATFSLENLTDQDETLNVRGESSTVPHHQDLTYERVPRAGVLVGCNLNLDLDAYTHKAAVRDRARRLIARKPLPGDYTPKPPFFSGSEAEWQAHEIAEAYSILEDLDRRRSMS